MIEAILITIVWLSVIGACVAVPAIGSVAFCREILFPAREAPAEFDLSTWVTVDQVVVDMGLEPHRDLTWSVGRQMRDRFEELTGKPPMSERRPKTSGSGSHTKTVYPPWMRSEIEGLVRAATNKEAAE